MTSSQSDRNVLFGVLALQMEFITQAGLIGALQAWTLQKSRPLGELLVELGQMSAEDRAALEPMVDRHVVRHGGSAEQSLAAISSVSEIAAELRELNDADLQHSLQHVEGLESRQAGSMSGVNADEDPPQIQPTMLETMQEEAQPAMRFQLLRPHAEGGLGKVWIARDRELNREVAFKEIKSKRAQDKNSRGRFVLEAEITGGLEHPGIVPVYGLGHFADGRPFYAMRFIRGRSLKEAIVQFHRELSSFNPNANGVGGGAAGGTASHPSGASALTPLALRLNRQAPFESLAFRKLIQRLIDVCNAIAYAHSRGVLHRDLKPGNIMLGKYGETLVVDWGLAKAKGQSFDLAASDTAQTIDREPALSTTGSHDVAATQMGRAVGTPQFMSPEQAAGRLDLLGPASDVYSLGATLYELLTGQAPIGAQPGGESERLTVPEVLRRVEQGEFPAPRSVLPAVPAPLEAVCLHAMSRDPHARYATAQALAEDLERWLAGEPVSVYREPLPVRVRRFVRRHQVAVTSLAAALVVALVGLGVLSAVVSGSNQRLNSANTTIRDQNSAITAKNEELQTTNEQLAAAKTDAETKRTQAEASEKIARDQSQLALSTLNSVIFDLQRAFVNVPGGAAVRQRLLATALEKLEKVSTEFAAKSAVDRQTMAALSDMADTILQLGDVRSIGGSPVPNGEAVPKEQASRPLHEQSATLLAERLYRRAHDIAQQLAAANPNDTDAQRDLSFSFDKLGDVFRTLGRTDDALTQFQDGLKIRRVLAEADPNDAQKQRDLSTALERIGMVFEQQGATTKALEQYEQMFRIKKRLANDDPNDAIAQRELGVTYSHLGDVFLKLGRTADALTQFQDQMKIRRVLAEADPNDAQKQRDLSISFGRLGEVFLTLGRTADALTQFQDGLKIFRVLAEADPQSAEKQRDLMISHYKLGEVHVQAGQFDQAQERFAQGIVVLDGLIAKGQSVPASQREKALLEQRRLFCTNAKLATGDWDTLLKLDTQVLPPLLLLRATEALKRGELPNATQAADKLHALDPKDKNNLYNTACVYARCAEFVTQDKPAPTDAEQAERQKFLNRALDCLKESLAAGWDDFAHMKTDDDLKPLRGLPEFEALFPKTNN